MTIIDEIRQSTPMQELFKKSPAEAEAFLRLLQQGYDREWPSFVEARDMKRQLYRLEGGKKDWDEVAVMPSFMGIWIKFLNQGGEPSKGWTRQWLKNNPEFWIKPNLFVRRG